MRFFLKEYEKSYLVMNRLAEDHALTANDWKLRQQTKFASMQEEDPRLQQLRLISDNRALE